MDSKYLVGAAPWVEVKLIDGTALKLTADHPTQPRRAYLPEGHVPAGDLRAHSDSLMVLKMTPVEVDSVTPMAESVDGDGLGGGRVALSLKQPDRHEVFVSTDRGGGVHGPDMTTVAVGSADARTKTGLKNGAGGEGIGLTVRRTFIDVDREEEGSKCRSQSAPPSLWQSPSKRSKARRRIVCTRACVRVVAYAA
eukprot:6455051-Amphidinium_carterae.1